MQNFTCAPIGSVNFTVLLEFFVISAICEKRMNGFVLEMILNS